MPRRSAADLSVVTAPSGELTRLHPPSSLSGPERVAFLDLVASVSANHFHPCDVPLVGQYSSAIVLAQTAAQELAKGAVAEGKVSPWLAVYATANKTLVALSMRLRVSPQARQPNNPTRPRPQASAYERMLLDDRQ